MRYSFHGGIPPKKKTSADALRVARHMRGASAPQESPISLPDKPLREFSFEEICSVASEAAIRTPLAPSGLSSVLERAKATDAPVRIAINCLSCQDGAFLNRYLCREKAEEIVSGAKILMQALSAREAVILVDDGDLAAIRALEARTDGSLLSLHVCEQKAPAATEKLLVYLAYKKELPPKTTPEENGFAVFDAEACSALFRAFAFGERMTEKLLCLTHFDGVDELISARFGLSISFTANHGNSALLIGGAISGNVLTDHEHEKIVIDGSFDSVQILKADRVVKEEALPCTDCGRCAKSCPMYLDPARMLKSKKPLPEADACIKCGICSAVCPSALDCEGSTRPKFRRYGDSFRGICLDVLIAILPSLFWGIYAYGLSAALILLVCVLSGVAGELLVSLILRKKPSPSLLFSSALSGLLCGTLMPSSAPLYLCAFASLVTSFVFVGLFRILKLPKLCPQAASFSVFALIFSALSAYAYPLRFFEGGSSYNPLTYLASGRMPSEEWYDLLFGKTGGAIGALSAFLIIIGGIYLAIRKVIDLRTSVAFFLGAAVVTYLCSSVPNPFLAIGCVVCTGSTALGAFFLAPQTVCSPKSKGVRYIYGLISGGGYVYLCTILPSQPMLALCLAIVGGNIVARVLDLIAPKAKPFGTLK